MRILVSIPTALLFVACAVQVLNAQAGLSPVNVLKQREKLLVNAQGETHLGAIMTIVYPAYGIVSDERYYSAFIALASALKPPEEQITELS